MVTEDAIRNEEIRQILDARKEGGREGQQTVQENIGRVEIGRAHV